MAAVAIDNVLRLEVLIRLTELLKTISPDNGYITDVEGNVFRGRGVFGDETPIPALSILEVPIPLDQLNPPENSTYSSGGWELVIQGFVKDDPENPTDPAHPVLADVKKILALEKKKVNHDKASDGILGLGNEVTNMLIGSGVVRPPDDLSAKAYFWLTVTLDLVEDLAEPMTIND